MTMVMHLFYGVLKFGDHYENFLIPKNKTFLDVILDCGSNLHGTVNH